ncbi:Centromere protein 3 [Talaromyces islandicus]|uniref:CENP-C homolog n=1 Tax=Talaromyces islandicus TaxID=28573 RepID=A0A0U1LJN3_TALIS|nr:Centromere protein 3 [Talaromyces islandicus]
MARGPRARDYDYSNVGTQGRRTGITLKEGRRDEHGMEELDGMFSSPERSPVRSNGIYTGNDTMMGSEGMSMDEDTAPGPADFLYRSDTRRSPYLPPPVARSPRKSGLSGSPRRTPGLRSSSIAQDERRSSSPSTLPQRGGRAPLNDRRPNTASAPIAKQKSREVDTNGDFSDNENHPVQDDEEIQDESAFENDIAGDVDVHVDDDVDDDFGGDSDDSIEDVGAGHADADVSEQDSPSVHASNSRANNRRSASARRSRDTDEEDEAPAEPSKPPTGNKLKRGRPGKAAKAQDDTNKRPAKKAKTTAPEPLDPELEKVVENHVSRTGPLKGRSLYILKREAPSEEQSTHTRSGRVSVRPLAYWRNERCVYGDGEAGLGQRYPLSTIKEIIRTEELQPETGKKKKRKRGKQSKKQDDESDVDPGEADEWEKDGILYGYAKKWDSDRQTGSKEEEAIEIAYASHNVETRQVKDSTFRLGKLLSYSFIGSGIVEIPPEGVKRPKNSKRMHMVFYVSHGRVQVDVNGVQFTAGKGCVFQVPRGNHYSFANTYKAKARLFFTQAFIPAENEGESEGADTGETGETGAAGEASTADNEAPLPKKGRGRGKKGAQ